MVEGETPTNFPVSHTCVTAPAHTYTLTQVINSLVKLSFKIVHSL